MDEPKTRRQSKKDQKAKARGNSIYTAKHVRLAEALREGNSKHKQGDFIITLNMFSYNEE